MKIKSNELFPTNYNNEFKAIHDPNHVYTEFVNAGGRGSVKSSFVSENIIILMLSNPDYNALVVRKVSNTLRDSVYNQIKWACEKLHVEHLFSFTLAPLQATYKPTGQTIYFRGADDPLKIKSIKATHGYIAITWFEETAEFSFNDIETIKLSSMRGGSKYWNFFSYNPPSSVRSWVNTEFRKPRKDRFFLESNYLSVNPDWLGEAFIFEAEEMKKNNLRAYENIFLGLPTGTGSNVFENIELREITDEEINNFEWNYYGVDWGFYPDAFRFIGCSYSTKENTLYIYNELSLLKHNNLQAYNKLIEHLEKSEIDINIRITADSAEKKSIADFRDYGANCRGAIKGVGSRDASFKWLQGIKKIVIDPARCPYAADEFSLYEYTIDKKTGEVLEGFPDGQPDHSIDAARYALEEVWRQRGV